MSEPFIAAVAVRDMFVDELYQRACDEARAARMADRWDMSLVGVLDVSDHGAPPDVTGDWVRYAVINGQHRWRAAILVNPHMSLACNVHQGLTREAEAQLFWDIDRHTKKLSTWDRWKARRGSGDPAVARIEQLMRRLGAPVVDGGDTYGIKSTATLEQMFNIDEWAMTQTVQLIVDVWPDDRAGLQGGVLRGLMPAVMACENNGPMSGRLADALTSITPTQLHARAVTLRDAHRTGQFWTCITRVVVDLYNHTRGEGPRLVVDDVIARGRTKGGDR